MHWFHTRASEDIGVANCSLRLSHQKPPSDALVEATSRTIYTLGPGCLVVTRLCSCCYALSSLTTQSTDFNNLPMGIVVLVRKAWLVLREGIIAP